MEPKVVTICEINMSKVAEHMHECLILLLDPYHHSHVGKSHISSHIIHSDLILQSAHRGALQAHLRKPFDPQDLANPS